MASLQMPIMPMVVRAAGQQQRFLQALHYLAPAFVLGYFLITTAISACKLQNLKASGTGPRKIVIPLVCLVTAFFLVESCMLIFDTAISGAYHSSRDTIVYTLFSLLVWTHLTVSLVLSRKPAVRYPYCGSWLIGLVTEAIFFTFVLTYGISPSAFGYVQLTVQACRMLTLVLLSTVSFSRYSKGISADEESASLLQHGEGESEDTKASVGKSGYGSITITADGQGADLEYEAEQRKKDQERMKELEKRLEAEGSWFKYIKSFSVFIPYLWPSKDRLLQAKLLGVCVCLGCTRALNVLEPRQLGIVVDKIGTSRVHMPIFEVLLWIVFRWLDSSVVSQIKYMLWLPLEQYAEGSLKRAAYNQVMGLSRDFHTEKRSGELYKSIDQGQSLTSIVEMILFKVGPMIIDLGVAFVYLCWVFGPYMALIVAATTMVFTWTSAYLIDRQKELRRRSIGLCRKEYQHMYDTVGGWSSVMYFNRREHEKKRYSGIVGLNLRARLDIVTSSILYWAARDTVIDVGQICACILALYQISNGAPVGSFVMLITYWGNFTAKLVSFAELPRQFVQNLIDAEALLDLFQKEPSVKDGKKTLNFKSGAVEFRGVGFSYDGQKEVIKDFNFQAQPGQRVALVGETGGGKSTILRLLFRFYDAQNGSVVIDDQDVRDITLSSLRENIGVVPQDPSLFHESIMENVRYARSDATDQEVMEACKAASIHDKILTFSKGYSTRVGEAGVVLSGGELQRVAIARVILKNPRIILLDEATSSVDTETETRITNALHLLTNGRTTFTVAHRLSTVKNSDIVLVIKDGMIAEQGSPRDLLAGKGEFSKLWLAQMEINLLPADLKPADPVRAEQHAELGDALHASSRQDNRRSSDGSAGGNKSLRATAPDFVPRLQAGTSTSAQDSHEPGGKNQQNHHESGNPKKNANKNKRNQKKKASVAGSLPTSEAFLSDSRPTTSDSKNSSQSQADTKKRGNPNPRRGHSKSEPMGSAAMRNGQSDGLTTSDEPLQTQPQTQPRRLSAVAANSSGQPLRHQWYNRRKKMAQSETVSGEASGAWSSDTLLQPSTNETSWDSANGSDPATAPAPASKSGE